MKRPTPRHVVIERIITSIATFLVKWFIIILLITELISCVMCMIDGKCPPRYRNY